MTFFFNNVKHYYENRHNEWRPKNFGLPDGPNSGLFGALYVYATNYIHDILTQTKVGTNFTVQSHSL